MRLLLLVVLAALPACVPPATYVRDVHYDEGGNLVANKCDFDYKGRATSNCHDEDIADNSAYSPPPDPADVQMMKKQLEATTPHGHRAAPDGATVAHALAAPSVKKSLALCKKELAPERTAFDFTLTLAPSGEISIAPSDAEYKDAFSSCASRALGGANLSGFDGDQPVSYVQQLII